MLPSLNVSIVVYTVVIFSFCYAFIYYLIEGLGFSGILIEGLGFSEIPVPVEPFFFLN